MKVYILLYNQRSWASAESSVSKILQVCDTRETATREKDRQETMLSKHDHFNPSNEWIEIQEYIMTTTTQEKIE